MVATANRHFQKTKFSCIFMASGDGNDVVAFSQSDNHDNNK